MRIGDVIVSQATVLDRDRHPDFLDLVDDFLAWAQSLPADSEHPLKPSLWFIELLNSWVDEDRRIPMLHLVRPSNGRHIA